MCTRLPNMLIAGASVRSKGVDSNSGTFSDPSMLYSSHARLSIRLSWILLFVDDTLAVPLQIITRYGRKSYQLGSGSYRR